VWHDFYAQHALDESEALFGVEPAKLVLKAFSWKSYCLVCHFLYSSSAALEESALHLSVRISAATCGTKCVATGKSTVA
jgi:hypothetical protein